MEESKSAYFKSAALHWVLCFLSDDATRSTGNVKQQRVSKLSPCSRHHKMSHVEVAT